MSESKNEEIKEYMEKLKKIENEISNLVIEIQKLESELWTSEHEEESEILNDVIEDLSIVAEKIYEIEKNLKTKMEAK
jgi:cell shape-determining protein MreC